MSWFELSETRLRSLISDFADAAKRGDPAASNCGVLVFVFGEHNAGTLVNQRGQAVIHYLLQATAPVPNVAIAFSANATAVLYEPTISITAPAMEGHSVSVSTNPSEFQNTLKNMVGES